jgi:hypothetical protein
MLNDGALLKNIALSVSIVLWLFAPVYLTRRLYLSASR